MDTPETCGERARPTHRIHHARRGVGAGETDADGAVDDGEDNEPPSYAPQCMAKNVIWIGIGGEGGHVARAPADCAGIGSEDIEDTDVPRESMIAWPMNLAGRRASCARGAGASKPLSARMEKTMPARMPPK